MNANPLRQELQKRVFWCAFGIDCAAALTLGRPLGIQLRDIDAEVRSFIKFSCLGCELSRAQFPTDIDDWWITAGGIRGNPRGSSSDRPTTMSTALHVFRLRCLWARMHASLYSDTPRGASDRASHSDCVKQLRTELETWISSIPPIPIRTGAALSIFGSREWYDLNYSETIILLNRDQLTKGDGAEDHVFLESARAAENICHGYRQQYIGKRVNYTWGTLHVLFSAGLTYLHCLWTSSAVRHAVRQHGMTTTLTDCLMILVVMAERWKNVGAYRDIFEALSSRTMSMTMEENRDLQTFPTSSTTSHHADPDDLNQWMADISEVGMSGGIDRLLDGLVGDYFLQGQGINNTAPALECIWDDGTAVGQVYPSIGTIV